MRGWAPLHFDYLLAADPAGVTVPVQLESTSEQQPASPEKNADAPSDVAASGISDSAAIWIALSIVGVVLLCTLLDLRARTVRTERLLQEIKFMLMKS